MLLLVSPCVLTTADRRIGNLGDISKSEAPDSQFQFSIYFTEVLIRNNGRHRLWTCILSFGERAKTPVIRATVQYEFTLSVDLELKLMTSAIMSGR
jgi:hypothetical protein